MDIKKQVVGGIAALAMVGGMAGAVSAGEVTGNGKATGMEGHAKSECAFSGQEDSAGSPFRTQTPHKVWNDTVAVPFIFYPPPGTPGFACSPGRP